MHFYFLLYVFFQFSVPVCFKDALASHHRKYGPEEGVNRINVERETLWEDSIITFKSPKFDTRGTLHVRFAGEAGLDAGGFEDGVLFITCKSHFFKGSILIWRVDWQVRSHASTMHQPSNQTFSDWLEKWWATWLFIMMCQFLAWAQLFMSIW